MSHETYKKPPTAVAAARGPFTQPVTDRRNETMLAYPQTVCQRPECDEFENSHATADGQPTHVIDFCPGARLEAAGDGHWALIVDAIRIRRTKAMQQFGAAVESAGKLADTLNEFTPDERAARNVRGWLSLFDHSGNSVRIREILEVSVARARDLYAGRTPYTESEVELLAAYFGLNPVDFHRDGDARPDYAFVREGRAGARRRGEDRVVTLREERRRLVAA